MVEKNHALARFNLPEFGPGTFETGMFGNTMFNNTLSGRNRYGNVMFGTQVVEGLDRAMGWTMRGVVGETGSWMTPF